MGCLQKKPSASLQPLTNLIAQTALLYTSVLQYYCSSLGKQSLILLPLHMQRSQVCCSVHAGFSGQDPFFGNTSAFSYLPLLVFTPHFVRPRKTCYVPARNTINPVLSNLWLCTMLGVLFLGFAPDPGGVEGGVSSVPLEKLASFACHVQVCHGSSCASVGAISMEGLDRRLPGRIGGVACSDSLLCFGASFPSFPPRQGRQLPRREQDPCRRSGA